MRNRADEDAIRALADALGKVAPPGTRIYLTGGASAVLEGWRESTIDIDLRLEPESDQVMREIPALKTRLEVSIEFASPLDFLPELPGWRDRSRFRFRSDNVEVFDFDMYSQALSKVERGFETDLADVAAMMESGLVEPAELRRLHGLVEGELFRFPAVDPPRLRSRLDAALRR